MIPKKKETKYHYKTTAITSKTIPVIGPSSMLSPMSPVPPHIDLLIELFMSEKGSVAVCFSCGQ